MNNVVLHVVNSNQFSGLESVACDIIENTANEFKGIYVTQSGPIIKTLEERNIDYEIIEKMSIKEIKRVIKKYNPIVIHAHDYTASCICSFSTFSKPIISHIHNNNVWIKKVCKNSLLFFISSFKFKKILTVSDSIKNEYVFSRFISKKIVNVGNPLEKNRIIQKKLDLHKEYDIVCLARLTEAKNPLRFLKIASLIKDKYPSLKVSWIGDGELKNDFIQEIKRLELSDVVKIQGFKENPYIDLNKGKVFLLTSNWEGFGIAAFEALSLGIPCVVSNVGGLPDVVDNKCGYLCKTDDEFVNSVLSLLNDETKYMEYSKEADRKSTELDNHKIYYDNIIKFYKNV